MHDEIEKRLSDRISEAALAEGNVREQNVLYLIHEVSRVISARFDAYMAPHNLTRAQWWALMHLHRHEGVTQGEFAEIMQLGRPAAGKLLERMEAKGWIERRTDPTDGRANRVYLTEGALPAFDSMRIEGRKILQSVLEGLSGDELDQVGQSLERIKQNGAAKA